MSRGLTFALDQLPEHMRKQAQAKLDAAGTVRTHVCRDESDEKVEKVGAKMNGERLVEWNGETLNSTQWALRLGITVQAFASRLARWPMDKVFVPRKEKKEKIPRLSSGEELLAFQLKAEKLTGFVRQYHWCPGRAYRADFAFVPAKLLIEVQGGVYSNGAHVRGKGYEYDRLRNNEAMIQGWRLLEFTPKHIKNGLAIQAIKRALEGFRT